MPRVAGVDIPNDKRIVISLTYVYGIGRSSSQKILKEAGISEDTRAKELRDEQISRVNSIISRDHLIEGELRRTVTQNIQRLTEIQCYRGVRHRRGLPVRGQRTRTNARTRKGKARPVATRKGIKEIR